MVSLGETPGILLSVFCVSLLGLLAGRIRIRGVELGSAAIFLVGLVFGHFGMRVPAHIQSLGLALFVSSVGMSAGPAIVQRLRQSGRQYAVLCLAIVGSGAAVCLLVMRLFSLSAPLAVGMMAGAYTTSPGFAAAKEAAAALGPEAVLLVAAGYGAVYPIGVLGKVLYVQLLPRFLRADMEYERSLIASPPPAPRPAPVGGLLRVDAPGLFPLSLAIVTGILLGALAVPLPWGGALSLGTTGGPLVTSLLLGCCGRLGPVDVRVDEKVLEPLKEVGLLLFFTGAGVEGGAGFAEVVQGYGALLFFCGLLLTFLPLVVGYFLSVKVLRLPLLNGLGSLTASMTSTPALGSLVQVAGTTDVVAAYAATYPIALVLLILAVQLLTCL